jgi:hypothetical protein
MKSGDLLYSNVDGRALCVIVRRDDGQWWDFQAGAFAVPPATFPPAQFTLVMTRDKTFPELQTCVIPADAVADPASVFVECLVTGGKPTPLQCYWAGLVPLPAGVPLMSARGAVVRFTA